MTLVNNSRVSQKIIVQRIGSFFSQTCIFRYLQVNRACEACPPHSSFFKRTQNDRSSTGSPMMCSISHDDPWWSNTKQHDTRAATTQSLHLHLCQVHSFSQDLSAQLKQKTHKKLHLFLGVARVKIWEQWPVWFNDLPTTKPGSFS